LFLLYVYKMARETVLADTVPAPLGRARSAIYIVLGVVGLYFGGRWTVDGAVGLARIAGVDDALIGLTVLAIGTSLPELIASAVAAWRNHADMAVGNIVGSNIFNLLWILGFTGCFVELPFEVVNNDDIMMVIFSSSLLILALVAPPFAGLRLESRGRLDQRSKRSSVITLVQASMKSLTNF
ncbi:MAG: hypothetical protein P8Y52_10375, partial [Xanthomonadales bacterium]